MQTILFFDLDATLVQNHFSRKAIGPLLQAIADGAGVPVDDIGREMGAENLRRQADDPDNPLTMDWDDIVETLAQRYDVALPRTVSAGWREFASVDDVQVQDNAHAVLKHLHEAGYTLVLATKGLSKYQLPVLEVSNLLPFFHDILAPDITGYLKTSPGYFNKYTQARAGKTFIHIGDHYYDDVICAKRNGFRSILRLPLAQLRTFDAIERARRIHDYTDFIGSYPSEGTETRPDAVVVSLQEVPALVREMSRSALA